MNVNVYDNWQVPTLDTTFQGGHSSGRSPTTTACHYNDLLQRASDFYATLDSPTDARSNSGSESSYRSSSDRRSSSSASIVAQVMESIPDKLERRREQNRSSQRAHRERKERHQRELEQQISEWQHKHQLLCRSYSQQSEEVGRLKAQVEQLNSEISSLQTGVPGLYGCLSYTPAEFDLVPFYNSDRFPHSSPRMGKSRS